jgi:hypothetical protein
MKPTVSEVMPLVRKLYERNAVGCCLHILLDDGNTEDSHAEFCLQEARRTGHLDCIELAGKILGMSRTQRMKLYRGKRG